ncbi:MAG: LacI family transcriptional regulator [Dehalococcoidia bacterium]|nr:MAG: LacI family transcriptional regulator [Dehalococcoidia bacterium]
MATERPRPVTLLDVANEAGVSVSTASRALTGARRVRGDLERRVRDAVENLGYRPNEAARGLRMARTMTLGIFFHRLNSPVSLDLIDGLGAAAHEARYSLAVTSARGDKAQYASLFQHFYGQRVDALMMIWPRGDLSGHLAPFARAGVPAFAMRWLPGEPGLTVISADNSVASTEAVNALAALGHKRLTIFSHGVLWTPATLRRPYFDRAGEAAGIEIRRRTSRDSGFTVRELVADELASPEPPTAFVVQYSEFSDVMAALAALGKRVPDDVSVVGFTDSKFASTAQRDQAAVIDVDSFELGRRMAGVMLEAIENGPPSEDVRIHGLSRWIPGGTIGPAPKA